jgi:exodeoxyribonuclease V alpha subunit
VDKRLNGGDRDIYGDIGVIDSIDLDESVLTVRYDDKYARYSFDILEELELAYAITVHKSQGSEYPIVILPMYYCAPMLMSRNLLYTAVTRAKNMVIMVGNPNVVTKMAENNSEVMRYTTLSQRLINI